MNINTELVPLPATTAADGDEKRLKQLIEKLKQQFLEVHPDQIDAFLRESKLWEY